MELHKAKVSRSSGTTTVRFCKHANISFMCASPSLYYLGTILWTPGFYFPLKLESSLIFLVVMLQNKSNWQKVLQSFVYWVETRSFPGHILQLNVWEHLPGYTMKKSQHFNAKLRSFLCLTPFKRKLPYSQSNIHTHASQMNAKGAFPSLLLWREDEKGTFFLKKKRRWRPSFFCQPPSKVPFDCIYIGPSYLIPSR